MPHLLCFGLGYVSSAFADQLLAAGWQVSATSRDGAGHRDLAHGRVTIHDFNDAESAISAATHIVTAAPPTPDGDPVLLRYREALAARGPHIHWMGYLGTTGVYGNHGGAMVDENTPCTPSSPRAERRLNAERAWQELGQDSGMPVHIFRLAGIYGPGRNAILQLQQGTARRLYREGQVFSRIHRDDIVAALRASIDAPSANSVYNVCDNLSVGPGEVVAYAAEITGLPLPPLEDVDSADISPMARSFWLDNKRVDNSRMKALLGTDLLYPDYKTGMNVLWQSLQGEDKK